MRIDLKKNDGYSQRMYEEFEQEVNDLLKKYQEEDPERMDLVQKKLEEAGSDWDRYIELVDGDSIRRIEISKLLAYEYCYATENITSKKVSFEMMLDKLFDGVGKFRIGNPVPGEDDECLYGKAYDDESLIPVTSKKYRAVSNAGAQHLDYFKNGKHTSAVFIFEESDVPEFAVDDNGRDISIRTNGINFSDLRQGQSLLTNLRQTAFHEWTHNAEKEIIEEQDGSIPYEYEGIDGRKYRNYDRVERYYEFDHENGLNEPEIVISDEVDERGRRKRFYRRDDGTIEPFSSHCFGLKEGILEEPLCISSGMTTKEVLPNGEIRMHNMITEGFVEMIAQDLVRVVDPEVHDLETGRYREMVELARRVTESRDESLGENGRGTTVSDFMMHSSSLKKELEDREVVIEDGTRFDGLHYISDFADATRAGRTPKGRLLKSLPGVVKQLQLSEEQIRAIERSKLWKKSSLSEEEKKELALGLAGGREEYLYLTEDIIEKYTRLLDTERVFFDGIGDKLGYTERNAQKPVASEQRTVRTTDDDDDGLR